MSTLEVLILPIDDVYDHINADKLSICKIRGYEAITAKDENGNHRFAAGEYIIYVPENSVVPLDVLKDRGYWDEEKNQGLLAGSQGNRVKVIKIRGVVSQGLVWKTSPSDNGYVTISKPHDGLIVYHMAKPYDDVAEFFGIQKYEEPIPTSMTGQLWACHRASLSFDIENYQTYPEFLVNDEVEVTEKLHGSFCRITYIPGLGHEDAFNGNFVIASKGLGARGLVFKNVAENVETNIYVRTIMQLGVLDKIAAHCDVTFPGATVHVLGEVYGRGVQDLHYGAQQPEFKAFDVVVCYDNKTVPLDTDRKILHLAAMGINRVPVLYRGPWDLEVLTKLRDGTTTVGGGNIREGIVITATGDQDKRQADEKHTLRPILKMVSPAYLTRKGGTELQ